MKQVIINTFYNLAGLGLPLLVAVMAVPVLIEALGVNQFGVLTIIWAIVGYFGLLDFGLGRTLTQQVAATMAESDWERLGRIVATANVLMGILGVAGGLLLFTLAPIIAGELGPPGQREQIEVAFYCMAIAMPAIILTSGYRGILEAVGNFGIINAIRLPMGIFTYAGPLLMVWLTDGELASIAAALSGARIVACLIHAMFARRALRGRMGASVVDLSLCRPLLQMGGWLSISNIVAPLMNYIDRLLIAFAVSAAAVAFYATPQEIMLRVGIIPTALTSVLFPLFASHRPGTGEGLRTYIIRYSLLTFFAVLPFTIVLALFAEPILEAWISPDFARVASTPTQVMAIATMFSALAQIPYAMLQGRGRADLTGKLHLAELPLYVALLYVLLMNFGIAGAAVAWLIRIASDTVAMHLLCRNVLRSASRVQAISQSAPVTKGL